MPILERSLSVALLVALSSGCDARRAVVRVEGEEPGIVVAELAVEEFVARGLRIEIAPPALADDRAVARLCAGEIDLLALAREVTTAETAGCARRGVELESTLVGHEVVELFVNPENSWATGITLDELRVIGRGASSGEPLRWSEVREGWPDVEVSLYGLTGERGLYDGFGLVSPDEARAIASRHPSVPDADSVLEAVGGDLGALGWLPAGEAAPDPDLAQPLEVNGAGDPIVRNAIARPLYFVSARSIPASSSTAAFLSYLRGNAPRLVKRAGLVSRAGS